MAKRTPNAAQIRVTPTGLGAITADPAAVIGPLVGNAMNGVITFPVNICSTTGTRICCDANQNPIPNCGPVTIDLVKHPGDTDRLVLAPQQGQSKLGVTVRARVKTTHDLKVHITSPVTADCDISLDTTHVGAPDINVATTVNFTQDTTTQTTRIAASGTAVTGLDGGNVISPGDYNLGGDFLCTLGGFVLSATDIEGMLSGPIEGAINDATCKSCTGTPDCGGFAGVTCVGGTCREGTTDTAACVEEIGIDGRMSGSLLFSGLSPGTTGGLDLYEVAGGYATTDSGGIALGMLGGMQPGGAPRDRCGPPGVEPGPASVTAAAVFQGNTDPDGNPFGVGFGLHKSQLAELAFGGYDGGLFCLTIGHNTVAQLTTDTISLVSRSLSHLNETNAPMAIGLRPQSAPSITLGNNTFMLDGTTKKLVDPLLDIKFTGMEIDFFAAVENQYVRVFTVVSDVHLPLGLDVGAGGTLVPVLGAIDNAFTNVTVKNSEAVTESPDDLAQLFPSLLNLVLPQLSGGLSPISLPKLGGLQLSVTKIGAAGDIDADGMGDFLAIFANLVPASFQRQGVETMLDIASIEEPDAAVMKKPRLWKDAKPPTVRLELGAVATAGMAAVDPRQLEYSLRVDEGSWTPWSPEAHPVLAPKSFWLPGVHHIEARARIAGQPETQDPTPALIALPIGTALLPDGVQPTVPQPQAVLNDPYAPEVTEFHGQSGAAGCACNSSGAGAAQAAPLALMVLMMVMPRRRRSRSLKALAVDLKIGAKRLPLIVWIAAVACLPGCSCGSAPCGDVDCMAGTLNGAVGRWTSIAADDQRVMVATYDQAFGDLVVADATDPNTIAYKSVDGVPTDVTPTYDPSTWRGGIEDPGVKVGAWTSIALYNHTARVSYQDRDANTLKYAFEDGDHNWNSYVVDAGHGEVVGWYTSMVIDADKRPAIAYAAVGIDDGMGHRNTELRIARAGSSDPTATADWGTKVIATATGTCGGLCSGACIAGANAGDPEVCVTPTTDCTPACAMGEVCTMAACKAAIPKNELDDIPTGTGLFVHLVVLPDGRLAAIYYDRNRRALVLAAESTKGSSDFAETVLDGNAVGADRGMWASAVVGNDGTVHIAYQDALGDQLMYTTWNAGTVGTPELVDDGTRTGDRTHNVGASSAIFLINGMPAIAYQDGLASDVYLAQKGSSWTTAPLAAGPLLDGFSIAATGTSPSGRSVLAWDSMDPARDPTPHGLMVKSP